MTTECDLLIVGGGPAGLCSAINGASEGLKVCLLDANMVLGGQARESSAIENYPLPTGFPYGVTGENLMSGFVEQARKFDTVLHLPAKVVQLEQDGERRVVTTEDYETFTSRAVILGLGVSYRRHPAKNIGAFMGRGVYYGLPGSMVGLSGKTVGVIGGANSAGQAVLRLARNAKTTVKMFVRSRLNKSMSQYLIDRISATANVEVFENTDVTEVGGAAWLDSVHTSGLGGRVHHLDSLFVFIGAVPKTAWLRQCDITLDDHKFVVTDVDLQAGWRLPYETSIPGVFAAGDVRAGSTKRISAAIGEGSGALASVHRYLSSLT